LEVLPLCRKFWAIGSSNTGRKFWPPFNHCILFQKFEVILFTPSRHHKAFQCAPSTPHWRPHCASPWCLGAERHHSWPRASGGGKVEEEVERLVIALRLDVTRVALTGSDTGARASTDRNWSCFVLAYV
jgi:hypothetical protein